MSSAVGAMLPPLPYSLTMALLGTSLQPLLALHTLLSLHPVLALQTALSSSLSCDFESSSLCGWSSSGASVWEVVEGGGGDPPETGPAGDHTTEGADSPAGMGLSSSPSSA